MSEKTPIEVAREVWPELEWKHFGRTLEAPLPCIGSMWLRCDEDDDKWYRPFVTEGHHDLREALTQAKAATADRLRAALRLCGSDALSAQTADARIVELTAEVKRLIPGVLAAESLRREFCPANPSTDAWLYLVRADVAQEFKDAASARETRRRLWEEHRRQSEMIESLTTGHGHLRSEVKRLTLAPETVAILRQARAVESIGSGPLTWRRVQRLVEKCRAWLAAGCPNLPTDDETDDA